MIKRFLLATAVALVAVTSASAAGNGVKTYAKNGNWQNYAGVSNQGDQALCGMSDLVNSTHIKYSPQTGAFWIMIFKNTWRIPNGTQVPMTIGFDQAQWSDPTMARGETKILPGVNSPVSMVTINIKAESVKDFLDNFRLANKMWLRFGGNEAPWVLDMTGSRETADNFIKCVTDMGDVSKPQATQPFSTAPTQPFSGSDRTQPDRPKAPGNEI